MTEAVHKSSAERPSESTMIRGDGVRLAAFASGDRQNPTLVFVHGFPDTHAVWDPVIAELEHDYHCVRYDVRGAGQSDIPRRTSAYGLKHLRADLAAVIDWARPDAPVHLIGHDWGSIQAWEAVTDDTLGNRIASFTSMSGPCLDHAGHWLQQRWLNERAAASTQLRKSWYVFAFHIPLLPGIVWRTLMPWLWPRVTARSDGQPLPASPTLGRDGANGVKLYRANVLPRLRHPRDRHARMPVQVITPTQDAFVGPDVAAGLDAWVDDLTITPVDAAHWALLTHPKTIARHCAAFIRKQAKAPLPGTEARR